MNKRTLSKWTPAEYDYLRSHYRTQNNVQLAQALGRAKQAVITRLYKLGLIRGLRKGWSLSEDEYLRAHYRTQNNRELGNALGRTVSAVTNRIKNLGLRRSLALRNKLKSATQFPKGHVPFNKGRKGIHLSRETEFKKGHLPANTQYDGCVTVRVHKGTPMKWIRLAQSQWLPLHHHKWIQKHGAIPPRHIIAFKNGNTLDCRMRNLRLMSKGENARRNWNEEKVSASLKRAWKEGKHFQKDRFIANLIAHGDSKLKEQLLKQPELLEIKRTQLNLRRTINEARAQTTL